MKITIEGAPWEISEMLKRIQVIDSEGKTSFCQGISLTTDKRIMVNSEPFITEAGGGSK